MADIASIIQQASLYLSDVGLETHPFKVGTALSLISQMSEFFIELIEVFCNNADSCALSRRRVYCNNSLNCPEAEELGYQFTVT